ncbi:DUF2470 domain-containing protein [Rhizomonospora bruguierae]|uniref:DUF2470 domain-containing protein n=1 Tax=Rhizomonospora bruguierae TaxID=1581705 RepID=UPI001BCD5541|nr:DUF2470 domain-containing protein [Micromonospora sp. NBRC 107566]
MSAGFPPEVVAAVSRHMNDDHAEDALLICRTLGGQPAATRARTTGLDADGIDFAVTVDGTEVPVRVPFAARLTERAQIRREVVRMYQDACDELGLPPRSAG